MAQNSGGWLYEADGTPVDKATADNAQARVLEIKADASAAKSDAASALSTANSYAGQIAQANTTAGQAVAIATDAKGTAESIEGPISTRLGYLETREGLAPGDVYDVETASVLAQPDSESNAVLKAQIEQATFTVSIEDFNPDEDFAVALSAAIDAAEDGGTVLFKTGKTYYTRGNVFKADKNCRLRFNGARILRAIDGANTPVLTLSYSITDVQPVTGIVVHEYTFPGTSTTTQVSRIQVADGSAWQPGDVCKVFSDDLIPWSVPSQGEKLADTFEVLAVEGNYLYSPSPLRVVMNTNVRAGKMTTKQVILEDPWVEDATGSSATRNSPAVIIRAPVGLRLVRPKAVNLLSEAFQVNSGFRSHIEHPEGRNLRTSTTASAYGYVVRENGPVDSKVIGGSGSGVRHVYTSGAFDDVAANSPDPWRYGGAVNVVMQGGLADSVGHSAWDFHDDAVNCAVMDASTRFNHREPAGSMAGLKLRGKGHIVKGFTSHGPGGIVEESKDNGGGHTVTNHVHVGIPGWNGGTAHLISNASTGRIRSNYSGEVHWDDFRGEMFLYTKANVHVPRVKIVARGTNVGTCRLFALTDSRVEIDELTVDLRGSTGTGAYEPRIFFLNDSQSEVVVHRLIIRADGAAYRLGDLANGNGTVRVGELIADTLPNVFQGGFANTGSGATFYADSVRTNGRDLSRAVEHRAASNVTLNPFSAGIQRLTAPLASGATVTEATVGVAPGREITYERAPEATGGSWWNIGNDKLETASTWLRRRYSGTAWYTVARGGA